jgi:hypothetical protein
MKRLTATITTLVLATSASTASAAGTNWLPIPDANTSWVERLSPNQVIRLPFRPRGVSCYTPRGRKLAAVPGYPGVVPFRSSNGRGFGAIYFRKANSLAAYQHIVCAAWK